MFLKIFHIGCIGWLLSLWKYTDRYHLIPQTLVDIYKIIFLACLDLCTIRGIMYIPPHKRLVRFYTIESPRCKNRKSFIKDHVQLSASWTLQKAAESSLCITSCGLWGLCERPGGGHEQAGLDCCIPEGSWEGFASPVLYGCRLNELLSGTVRWTQEPFVLASRRGPDQDAASGCLLIRLRTQGSSRKHFFSFYFILFFLGGKGQQEKETSVVIKKIIDAQDVKMEAHG